LRARQATGEAILRVTQETVELRDDVEVDFKRVEALARSVVQGGAVLEAGDDVQERWWALCLELLNDRDDAHVLEARDHWDRLRMLALEELARGYLRVEATAAAIELATAATKVDELSEPPHRIVAEAYLLRRDFALARRTYAHYAKKLRTELGAGPSLDFEQLVAG
jgi:DNA-binding SARP family transcriptional activator